MMRFVQCFSPSEDSISLPTPAGIIHIYIRSIISPHKITGEPYLVVFKVYKFISLMGASCMTPLLFVQ